MAIIRKAAARAFSRFKKPVATPEPVADEAADAPTGPQQPEPHKSAPNPMTNLILADIALRGGGALLRRAVEQSLLGKVEGAAKAKRIIKGRTMTGTLVGSALARIATRSVPGAIVVGGGLLAKTLYDRKRTRRGAKAGEAAPGEPAKRG